METDEFGTVFVFVRERHVNFILRLVAIGRGIVSLIRILHSVLYLGLRSRVWLHPTLY